MASQRSFGNWRRSSLIVENEARLYGRGHLDSVHNFVVHVLSGADGFYGYDPHIKIYLLLV